jgi:hypothetical protein
MGFFANVAVAGIFTAQNYLGNSYEQYKEEREREEEIKFRDPKYAEEERKRNRKDIDFIMNSDIKDNPIINPMYDKMIDKLKKLNDKVSSITNINGISNDVLLQELKYTVLLKHFQNVKPSYYDLTSLAYFGDWCGKNSDILNNLKKESNQDSVRYNTMQRICKKHDLAYSKSMNKDDVYKADVDMLKSIIDTYFISGSKAIIDEPYTNFVDYISNQISNLINPINYIDTVVNLGFTNKLYSNIRDFTKQSYVKNAVDLAINKDRIGAILAFGAIGSKVFYDMLTGNVYGFSETRFKPEEVKEILIDFEKNINQHLEMTGYDSIDMFKIIDLPEQEFEKAINIQEQEPIIYKNTETQTLPEEEEEEEEYVDDNLLNNTRDATEDEIDYDYIIDVEEEQTLQNYLNYLNNLDLQN